MDNKKVYVEIYLSSGNEIRLTASNVVVHVTPEGEFEGIAYDGKDKILYLRPKSVEAVVAEPRREDD